MTTSTAGTIRRGRRLLSGSAPLVAGVGVTIVALLIALLLVAIAGHSLSATASAFWAGSLGGGNARGATLELMIPLVIVALGWIIASSARQVNLGFEGQIVAGGICATIVGTHLAGTPHWLHLTLSVLAGIAGGAAYAAVPAFLQLRRGVSVLLSTFMLNFVALLLVQWLVRGPLKDPTNFGLLQSKPVDLNAQWPALGTSGLTWDIMLVPIAVVALVFVQRWTSVGFRLRLVSANEEAARHAGIRTRRLGAGALIVSGGLAGLVGSSLILDSLSGSLTDGFSSGYGYLGIAVALLARNSPVGCLASGLLFAALQQGGGLVQTQVGIPSSLVGATQGLVIVLVAGSAWLLVRARRGSRPLTEPQELT